MIKTSGTEYGKTTRDMFVGVFSFSVVDVVWCCVVVAGKLSLEFCGECWLCGDREQRSWWSLFGCSSCSLDMAGTTGESRGEALMGAQETQRLLRRSSSGSQVPDFGCCLERVLEFGLEIRECRLENTCWCVIVVREECPQLVVVIRLWLLDFFRCVQESGLGITRPRSVNKDVEMWRWWKSIGDCVGWSEWINKCSRDFWEKEALGKLETEVSGNSGEVGTTMF